MILSKSHNSCMDFDWIMALFVLRKFLVQVLRALSIFKTTEGTCIHLKLNTYLQYHNLWSLSKSNNSSMDFDWIMALFVLRKLLFKVLCATSILKTTQGIHSKLKTHLRDHNLWSLSKSHNSSLDFNWIMALFVLINF